MPAAAPTPPGYSNLVDETVAPLFLTETFDNTLRIQPVMERLKKNGNISTDNYSKYINIPARIGEFSDAYSTDLNVRSWARQQQFVNYAAPFAIFEMLAALSENDIMFMNSPQAYIKEGKRILADMSTDFQKKMNRRILRENGSGVASLGAAVFAGSQYPFNGLPSIFGTGTTQNYNDITQTTSGAIGAADREALPNGTYYGISTHPTNAIAGVDGRVNEATSPVIANWSSTAWNGSAGTWLTTGDKVLSHLIMRLTRGNGPDQRPDLAVMSRTNWEDLRGLLRTKATQMVVLQDNAPRVPDVGMLPRIMFNYEGLDVLFDVDQLSNVAYVLNTQQMKYMVFPQVPAGDGTSTLKGSTQPLFSFAQSGDINQGAYKAVAKHVGQLWANPFYQGAAFNFA